MKKKRLKRRQKKYYYLIIVVCVVWVCLFGLIFYQSFSISQKEGAPNNTTEVPVAQEKVYTSKDLSLKFSYPAAWYIKDLGYRVIITNYKFVSSTDYRPNNNEVEIQISNYQLCQGTLDQDVVFWGCGEEERVANQILEKATKELDSGILSNYLIFYPQSNIRQRQYYLQKGDRILQIDRAPDSSRFEKEFEKIINTIIFLE